MMAGESMENCYKRDQEGEDERGWERARYLLICSQDWSLPPKKLPLIRQDQGEKELNLLAFSPSQKKS